MNSFSCKRSKEILIIYVLIILSACSDNVDIYDYQILVKNENSVSQLFRIIHRDAIGEDFNVIISDEQNKLCRLDKKSYSLVGKCERFTLWVYDPTEEENLRGKGIGLFSNITFKKNEYYLGFVIENGDYRSNRLRIKIVNSIRSSSNNFVIIGNKRTN